MRMRAAQYDRYGGPEVLEVRTVEVPSPGLHEMLVRVHASGLNPKDSLVRTGALRPLSGWRFPRGTGFDFAGEVVRAGGGIDDLAPGARVWGFLDGYLGGAAADYLTAPRKWMSVMPEHLDWIEAGAMPLVATTALQALRDVGRLASGERLLIKGASGGVGSAAIQIGAIRGAHVTAMARGDGVEYCRSLGAHEVVAYRQIDPTRFRDRFDVFLDCVGRSPVRAYRRLLRPRGRWVTVAPSLPVYSLAPLSPLSRVFGWPRFSFVAVKPLQSDLEELARLVDGGLLRMPVTGTFPLEEIRAAHSLVAKRHGRGKRVIVVSPIAAADVTRGSVRR
ncbi:MAG TPA: NAD(P)-dependent alcohol dehydrogenase [Gemmatimonadales bacterium]|nr:NAD(P)-dependent alcohol dehydrogenase [Gemmatimonadales bacterium]